MLLLSPVVLLAVVLVVDQVACVAMPIEASHPKVDPEFLKSLQKVSFDTPFAPMEQSKNFFQAITAMPVSCLFCFAFSTAVLFFASGCLWKSQWL